MQYVSVALISCNLQAETWTNNYTAVGNSYGQTYELFSKIKGKEKPSGRTTRKQTLLIYICSMQQHIHVSVSPYISHCHGYLRNTL